VDISTAFIASARERAVELDLPRSFTIRERAVELVVDDRVEFEHGDASEVRVPLAAGVDRALR
jgi:hypothetical protein